VAVTVRLDDEFGRRWAGLWLGRLRKAFTDFIPAPGKCADSLQWTNGAFLDHPEQVPTAHYRRAMEYAEVRREKEKILVTSMTILVIESSDAGLPDGKVGLAKFRDTAPALKRSNRHNSCHPWPQLSGEAPLC